MDGGGDAASCTRAGTPYRDMTVLYRAHYVTRAVEEVLLREKIPYTIYSGVPVFRPDGDQGRPLLPAHDRLPGRPVLPAHRQRAQAQSWASGGWHFCRNTRSRQGCPLYQRPAGQVWRTHCSRGRGRRQFVVADRVPLPPDMRGAAGVRGAVRPPQRERLREDAPHRGQPGTAGQSGGAEAVGI